ncbi:tetratricopeptide repeat-containing sensor histidine kinase [Fulvivirga ligni]|uniref:tetratricopeptide repeat-containing sensor histidine kinase n=1 Tax=Fulvivirga ligni TaxID=2904246 RepID=UPI001F23E3A1|nr:tetratricopeptide repeat-containing sensor histidine kinase [Fulvivirga ligni]UII20330.1 tetratricopeptide repeat-containing sensor histidine kinase [Fulvivirga ligni]
MSHLPLIAVMDNIWKILVLSALITFVSLQALKAEEKLNLDSLIKVLNSEVIIQDSNKLRLYWFIYSDYPDPDVRINYAIKSIKLAKQVNRSEWLHHSYLHLGYAYKLKGDLYKALEALIKSGENAYNSRYKATVNNAIASVYRMQGNYTTAIGYYKSSIKIFREENDSLKLASSLLNAGELYRLNDRLDSALLFFDESKVIYNSIHYTIGTAYNQGNIGLVYAEQDKYDSAELYLNEAITTLDKLGDKYPISVYNISMADICQDRGEYQKALEYAQNSFDVAMQEGFKEQVRDASQKLSELYSETGDYQKAFQYQGKYLAYKDSVVDQETIRKMADMRTEYEVNQKQTEVDLLESEKKRQEIIAISLGVVAILITIVAFLLYKNNKQRRKVNYLLKDQKEEIEAQRDQLDELNRTKDRFFSIISHDLRGPVHAFKGMSRLIKILVEEENIQDLRELNEHFDSSVNQLSTLLDDLLDWAVAQQGNIPHNPEKVELSTLSEGLTKLFQNMARAKNIQFESKIDQDLAIWADLNCVNTILRNIVNNALKFTPDGGKITLSARKEKRFNSYCRTGYGNRYS